MKAFPLLGFTLLSAIFLLSDPSFARSGYDIPTTLRIGAPPRAGSAAERKDYDILLHYQHSRTDDECRAAAAQQYMTAKALFGPQHDLLSESEFAALEPLLDAVIDTAGEQLEGFKKQYARVRPYNNNAGIHPCIPMPKGSTSYPSSHATSGVLGAETLALLFPERAEKMREHGFQIGENRLLGGVHHPSDVEAGRELADQIWEALQSSSAFQKDLASARRSLP